MSIAETNPQTASAKPGTNPYKFLDYYVEADQLRFSGRDRDVREVVDRVMTDRACVLYGRSGLGKTSLMLAGVFPELRSRGFVPIYARVLESPLPDACKAVADALALNFCAEPDQLLPTLKALSTPQRVVLALDQFEEFFIRFGKRPEERRAFSSWLAAMTASENVDFRVLVSLREEYLSRLDEFTSELPAMFGNEYRLRPLSAFGARQAITRPLVEAGIEYDQKLINKVVDLLAAEDFDSLLLQIVCSAIYREALERSEGQVHLKECDLQSVGGLEGILRRYLDSVTENIAQEHILLYKTILDTLITAEGTKRAVTLQTLLAADFNATEDEVKSLLESLERSRLVRAEMRGGQLWYELTHERLVRHIIDWFKLDRTFADFRAARELISSACRGDRAEQFRERLETLLAPGHVEGVIRPFRERLRLEPLQMEFVFWSAVYHRASDVEFWAKVWGYENSTKVLVHLAGRPEVLARRAAMFAITAIPGPNRELIDLSTKLVIQDPDIKVRRQAGESLGVIAEASDIAKLGQMASSRSTRNAAGEALADIRQAGRSLDGVSFRIKRRVEKLVKRRSYRLNAEAIRERCRTGAIAGLLAGCAWTLTVGFIVTLSVSWLSGEIPARGQLLPSVRYIEVWAFSIPVLLALATFIGWKSSRRAARRIAYNSQEQPFYSLGTKRTIFWCFVTAVGITGIAFLKRDTRYESLRGLATMGVLLAILLLSVAGQISLICRSFWPGVRQKYVLLWALLQSLGLPLLFSGVAMLLVSSSNGLVSWYFAGDRSEIWLLGSVFGILLSFAAFVTIISLSQAAARYPIGPDVAVNMRQRRVARWLVALAAIGFVSWFGFEFLPASAPFRALVVGDSASAGIPSEPFKKTTQKVTASWPNSQFLRFQVHDPLGEWFQVSTAPQNSELSIAGGSVSMTPHPQMGSAKPDLLLFVPHTDKDAQLAALSTSSPMSASENRDLTFDPLASHNSNALIDFAKGEQLQQITFERSDGNGEMWSAEFSGQLSPGTDTEGKVVRMTLLNPGDPFPKESTPVKVIAQFQDKPDCTGNSVASFYLPRSFASLIFYPRAQATDESNMNSPLVSPQRFLQIPIDEGNSFHVHLQLSLADLEANAAIRPGAVFRRPQPATKGETEAGKGLGEKVTVAVAIELAAFENTQEETIALLEQKKYKEAVASARRTANLYPEDSCSQNNLAWALLEDGQMQEAVRQATLAVQMDRQSSNIEDTLAHAAYGAKQWEVAADAWDHANILDPNFFSDRKDPQCRNDRVLFNGAKRRAQTARKDSTR